MTDTERTYKFPRSRDLPNGPWLYEHDKVQWVDTHTDLDCMIIRNHMGAWCGYVGVTKDHPWFGRRYHDGPESAIDVHGGITFSAFCNEEGGEEAVCHVPFPGRSPNVWWFGFDCGHAWDLVPSFLKYFEKSSWMQDEVYRDENYAKEQCAVMAAQLAEVESD